MVRETVALVRKVSIDGAGTVLLTTYACATPVLAVDFEAAAPFKICTAIFLVETSKELLGCFTTSFVVFPHLESLRNYLIMFSLVASIIPRSMMFAARLLALSREFALSFAISNISLQHVLHVAVSRVPVAF